MKNCKSKIMEIREKLQEVEKAHNFYLAIDFNKRTKSDNEAITSLGDEKRIYREILDILEK